MLTLSVLGTGAGAYFLSGVLFAALGTVSGGLILGGGAVLLASIGYHLFKKFFNSVKSYSSKQKSMSSGKSIWSRSLEDEKSKVDELLEQYDSEVVNASENPFGLNTEFSSDLDLAVDEKVDKLELSADDEKEVNDDELRSSLTSSK